MAGFDGVTLPRLSVLAGLQGDPGPDTLVIGVGPPIGTGVLGGVTMAELAQDATLGNGVRSVVRREWGRDNEVDSAQPQQCEIVIGNQSGHLDPLNPATPWWGTNLLSTNQASLETDTAGWQVGGSCTIASSAAQSHVGARTLALTSTVTSGGIWANTTTGSGGIPVAPGQPIRVSAWFRSATRSVSAIVAVMFWDKTGAFISQANAAGVATSTSGWVQGVATVLSPEGAATASMQVLFDSVIAVGEVHYADDMKLQATALDIGLPVQVDAELAGVSYRQFTGKVVRVLLDAGHDPTVTFQCADAMEDDGRAVLAKEAATFDGDFTGQRIGNLLGRAGVPVTAQSLDKGNSRLGYTTLGGPLLDLIRQVELTEFGFYFVDAEGRRVFYDRHRSSTANRSVTVQLTLGGSPNVSMASLELDRSTDRVWNDWHITRDQKIDPVTGEPEEGDAPQEQVGRNLASIFNPDGTARYGCCRGRRRSGSCIPATSQPVRWRSTWPTGSGGPVPASAAWRSTRCILGLSSRGCGRRCSSCSR
jgi:hypothetical protein